MRLQRHDGAASFLDAVTPLLASSEAEYSIIAMPAARMLESPQPEDAQAYMASVALENRVVGAALHLPPGGVLLTAGPPAALAAVATDMAGRALQPESVVGPRTACEAFAQEWRRRTGEAARQRFDLRHFALTVYPPPPAVPGMLQEASPERLPLLAAWCHAFAAEIGLPDDAERVRVSTERRIARQELFVWSDGDVVSLAGFRDAGRRSETARVAPVFTPPGLRGRGYARAAVSALSRELLRRGKRAIFLTTDLANPVSNAIYQRLGYRPAGDHVHLDLARPP